MRKVDMRERRSRMGIRHRLADPVDDPSAATRAMLALHSSDPVTVYLANWARVRDFEVADLEKALYSDRSLVRMYGMRRTLWVVERDTVPLIHNSTTRRLGQRERKRTAKLLERAGVTEDGIAWLDEVAPQVLRRVGAHGEVLTRDLSRELRHLGGKIEFYNRAGRLQGSTGVLSRVLLQLSLESKLVRTRPAGSWVSGQYRWADMTGWLGQPIASLPGPHASAELIRQWLWTCGPATETDLKWWTGWTSSQIRAAIEDVGAVEVRLEDGVGYLLADDLEPVATPEPWVALLPSLDPTTMAWKERDWYLGRHAEVLFDSNGNAGPTVWADGRVVGGWSQRADGEIAYEVFEDIGKEAMSSLQAVAVRLGDWLGDTVVTPRFRSPHHRSLSG